MAKGMRSNIPSTPAGHDKRNRMAHIPHGPNIPAQNEAGAQALVASHRKVVDKGMITQRGPLTGSADLPYNTPGDGDGY